jgi:hypothetical protein
MKKSKRIGIDKGAFLSPNFALKRPRNAHFGDLARASPVGRNGMMRMG